MTTTAERIAQAQHALVGIGFPIAIDGALGPQTRRAVAYFQESWTHTALPVTGLWDDRTAGAARLCLAAGGRVSDHFTLTEFACPHCKWPRAHRSLLLGLEVLRGRFYTAGLAVRSGYRCPTHNAEAGGAQSSQHMAGRAADVPPRGDGGRLVSVEQVAELRVFGGLEFQPAVSARGVTHVDTRVGVDPAHPAVFPWPAR